MEFKRVLLGKSFLFFLVLLLVLNGFFFLYQQRDYNGYLMVYNGIYDEMLTELEDTPWDEAAEICRTGYEEYLAWNFSDRETFNSDPVNSDTMYVYSQLQSQYTYLMSYENYLAGIDEDVKKLQAVSFFSDPNSVAYKNTVKTAEDFNVMKGVTLTPGRDLAVTRVFQDDLADYSILLLLGLVCGLFLAERKSGLWPAIHAAPGGRAKLAGKRIAILLIAAFVGTYVIVGSKILLSGWFYHGLGEWDRMLQSIPMFQNTPVPMTVGQFWGMYLLVKALGAFWIALVLWAVLSAISNLGLALCALGLLVGLEFACTAILPSSMFAILRYCNIFSYVNYVDVFTNYLNLSFFGLLISGSMLVLVILPVLIAVFIWLDIRIAVNKKPISAENPLLRLVDKLRKKIDPFTSRGNLIGMEFKKVLIKRKGIFLLIALIVVLTQMNPPSREYDPLDMYLQYYEEKYAGPINEQTIANLQAEMETAAEPDRMAALSRLIMECEMAPEGAWMLPTNRYEAIWSNNLNNYHRNTALIAMLFLVLLLSNIGSQEKQSNMTIQLITSPLGRTVLWRKKLTVSLTMASLVWLLVYGTELILVTKFYGKIGWLAAPMNSLSMFQDWSWNGSLGAVMALYYGLKLMSLFAVAQVCVLLSGLCQKNQSAILLCTGVILVPAALAAIGSDAAAMVSLLLPVSTVEHFRQAWVFLLTAGVGIGAAAASWYLQAKRYRS